jgi:hypothetical protein
MSTIRAGTTLTTALVSTGDTTGNIVLQPDSGVASISATGALTMPVGTTAQRPASPAVGQQRWNSSLGSMEFYDGASWQSIQPLSYTAEYLVIAGGGGGGAYGGGGAGGYITGSETLTAGQTRSITVGAGGAANANYDSNGFSGQSSSYAAQSTVGGGYGATYSNAGGSGGSGGGGGYNNDAGGAGTAGQGSAGGSGTSSSPNFSGGGGGGKNAVGTNATPSVAGNGGAGLVWLNGTTYGGGGGGATWQSSGTKGTGGTGGGGNGGTWASDTNSAVQGGSAGSANTGGGGGGRYAGGSGVVIIRYAGGQRGTGGTVTSSGGFTYHTFTSSGTYTA